MVTPDQPGISMSDWQAMMAASMVKHMEMKAHYDKILLPPTISDELQNAINEHIDEFWKYYIETRADKYQEDMAKRNEWKNNPEAKAKVM